MGWIDKNKDILDNLKGMIKNVNNKVDDNAGRNEANTVLLNQSVEQNTRKTRNLMHVINRMQLEIANLTNIIVDFKRKCSKMALRWKIKVKKRPKKIKMMNKEAKTKKAKARKKIKEVIVMMKIMILINEKR
jgi:hypothetical protein